MRKILPLAEMIVAVDRIRGAGGIIVLATGCFDVLHVGHVRCLEEARGQGDVLIVGVNDDDVVRKLKGPSRPINPAWARCEVLAALACVDLVCIFDEATPAELILRLRPNVFVKGGDYTIDQLPEAEALARVGAKLYSSQYHAGFSSTAILAKERCAIPRTGSN